MLEGTRSVQHGDRVCGEGMDCDMRQLGPQLPYRVSIMVCEHTRRRDRNE